MPKASALANVWPWENHCLEDGHSFRPGIAFTICTNQFHFNTGKRPRRPETVWNIPSGKTGLPFQMFRCSQQFSVSKKPCSIYFPTGKQPWSWALASPGKIKNIRICMGKNLPFQKKTTKMKGIHLKRTFFHWEPLKIFTLGIALAPRKGRRPSRYEIAIRGSKFLQDFYGSTIFCILQEQFFGMSTDCQEPIMHLSLEGVGICGVLYLPERGSLSLKAQ